MSDVDREATGKRDHGGAWVLLEGRRTSGPGSEVAAGGDHAESSVVLGGQSTSAPGPDAAGERGRGGSSVVRGGQSTSAPGLDALAERTHAEPAAGIDEHSTSELSPDAMAGRNYGESSAGHRSSSGYVHRALVVDGLRTHFLEAGAGEPVVLLHGGEFGASAEISWEETIAALAQRYHVFAPDMLGFGESAKVVDFTDGRGLRIRHIARFCALLGIESAYFVGNSMGAVNLLADATADHPVLPVRAMVTICGGGRIQAGEHMQALYDFDATLPAMRRIVTALFASPAYPADEDYVRRRFDSATAPGAWEAIAAARFRRPDSPPPPGPGDRPFERIRVPTLVVEGGADKLLPPGWAAELAARIPDARSAVVEGAGHCPQLERPEAVNALLLDFLDRQPRPAPAPGYAHSG
jgi:pimeloyl-ACP methyl ester carboxylesterase